LRFHFQNSTGKNLIMLIPVIRGLIDRRILVNYRVEPDVLAGLLPAPFRPKLIHGRGLAGVCLIRLRHLRPRMLPAWVGLFSENAAHRVAVEWDQNGETKEGVFIPRRDTSSRLTTLSGGRLFPGMHSHADFQVEERDGHYRIELTSDDNVTHLLVDGHVVPQLPADSAFQSLQEASDFFERGSLGYSVTARPGQYDGLELCSFNWRVQPLEIEQVQSSYFENPKLFPAGSVVFDCALLMRGIDHEWHGRGRLSAGNEIGLAAHAVAAE
jgi:hypothetical protein